MSVDGDERFLSTSLPEAKIQKQSSSQQHCSPSELPSTTNMATKLVKTDDAPFTTFTCFPNLPLELRRLIFKEVCYIPRIYTFEVEADHAFMPLSSIGNLPILDVSSEAKATALEVLRPTWSIVVPGKKLRKARIGKLLMSSSDTVYFESTSRPDPGARASIALLECPGRLHVTRIAFELNALEACIGDINTLLKFLIWTCPEMEFVIVDRQPARLLYADSEADRIMKMTIEERENEGLALSDGQAEASALHEVHNIASLQLLDLDKKSCYPFGRRQLGCITELAKQPKYSDAAGVFPFHMPITKKADFQMPVFRRMGLTLEGVRI
ncbi:hypothetical protein VTL71DRAFT_12486 [Oculimacula yallundae]|uniref:2EXR domain-containing protein n=1 Tax=Oculimacula yallundae TaxID=86028 RepID=A0ABR4CPW7_9HELO